MNRITLQNTLPEVFVGKDYIDSEVWHKDVEFEKGDFYLIEAASGTGKSSLCSYVYGYRNDYQGIICFDDNNIRNMNVKQWVELRKKSLSMLFQDLRLFTELTAMENVLLKNSLTGFKKKKEIKDLFYELGIGDKMNVEVGKMSFGQQQRVALIRALCQPFDFLFLDEPVSHLDEVNANNMARIITEEAARQGAGVIATSIGKHLELDYTKKMML
ncbi:MAG: ATP-binding cassette domain-containing protein [Bacteroidaceae bacterium]|nr:ATP-binding cassette domain-containing protein [Bacteroidaceae bacterium]